MDFAPLLQPQLAPFLALVITLALVPAACGLAHKVGLVDDPGGRKHHEGSIPLVGGLVIFAVFIVITLLSGASFMHFWPLYAGLALILFVGVLDDRFEMAAWPKFLAQISAAMLIVVMGDAELVRLGNLFGLGTVFTGWFSIPFSIAAVVLLINAINLMDGLDGLAAGKSFIVVLWLMIACALVGEWPPFWLLATLLACIGGFLFYNMRHPLRGKATVFLGDAGSMALGLTLAWFCIGLTQEPDPALTPISIAWIVALPVIDACGQFARRVSEGRHPFSPDRGHFHHHFVHAGIPVGHSTVYILLLGFVLGGVGIVGILIGIPQFILTIGWIALLFSHIALSSKPERYITIIGRLGRRDV